MAAHLRTLVNWTASTETKGLWLEEALLEKIVGATGTPAEAVTVQRSGFKNIIRLLVQLQEPTWTSQQVEQFVVQNTTDTD